MPWSPSKPHSLPSLRPGQFPPPAASRGRSTSLEASKLHPPEKKAYSSQSKNTTQNQSFSNPTSTSGLGQDFFQSSTALKRKETSSSDEADLSRPFKASRFPSKSLKDASRPLPSSSSPRKAPPAPVPTTSRPFFSLTKSELKELRRSMGKGSGYTQFRSITIARALDGFGRGWDGYLQAKDRAEQQGKIDEFRRHFSLEVNTILSTTQFPPGAISMETAALAAQTNYTASVGRLRPEHAAEIRRLRAESQSSLPDSGLACQESGPHDSVTVRLPSSSPSVPQANSHSRQEGSPDPVPVSRPRRVLQRPDYRIPPLFESSPEAPSSPDLPSRIPSPTPRELYNKTQPKFVQYPCEWNGCKASLNNLETLQKHIRIVHGEEARDTLYCRWGNCDTHTPTAYDSPEGLEIHFEIAHLRPLMWHLGDGIKGHEVVAKAAGGRLHV